MLAQGGGIAKILSKASREFSVADGKRNQPPSGGAAEAGQARLAPQIWVINGVMP